MKAIRYILLAMQILGAVGWAAENEKSPATLLQEAVYQEETEGNLDKAIELYGQVLTQAADVERLAARATYQLGLCHLKKGDQAAAAEYFRKVINSYPKQISVTKKANEQLEKIEPESVGDMLFTKMPEPVLLAITNMYGRTCTKAGGKELYTNSNIHYVDSDFISYNGGIGYLQNRTGLAITQSVRLSGTSNPRQSHFDVAGRKMNTRIVPSETTSGMYDIYWTPDEPVGPGQFFMYGWCLHQTVKLPDAPGSDRHILIMENNFGCHAFEVFYLVIPDTLQMIDSTEPFTEKQAVDGHIIYAWEKEVQPGKNHVVTAYLSPKKDVSPEELKGIVEKAVLTISTCAETDPKVTEALNSLKGLDEQPLVAELTTYLDSEAATIRRSAEFILWRGQFANISAASQKLITLCGHAENYTRGMAALALGQNKIADSYDALVNMTLKDDDAFARRCGAYALGLLGDTRALPILEQALQDKEELVKANAQAAITMLRGQIPAQDTSAQEEPAFTQEMYNDIQPDGTIKFRNPQQIDNSSGTEPITEQRFINSDFVQLTAMTDTQGKPIEFTSKHEGSIYRYHVKLDPAVMPGETFTYISEGTITGLVIREGSDTFRYYMTHSPATNVPTLRIEEYLLPAGAELISTLSEMEQTEKDGRIRLRVEKVIPAGGNLTTSFKYKLAQ